ncbi:hypothetical protein ACOSQ4_017280 [Xanthoceras sorbifolium]
MWIYRVYSACLRASSPSRGSPASNMRCHSDEFLRHGHDVQGTLERVVMDSDDLLMPPLRTADATPAANSVMLGILLGSVQKGKVMESLT